MTSCDVLATSASAKSSGWGHYPPQVFNRLSMATGK